MTFTEYQRYEAPLGRRDELINGEIVLSPSPNRRHQDLCIQLQKLLDRVISSDYVARLHTTINLGIGEGPRPDVFVIDRERWVSADEHGGYPQEGPQLVVEVKSESNSWPELLLKKDLFLSDPGCLAVWIVDTEQRAVHLYMSVTHQMLAVGQTIFLPTALGGDYLVVAEIVNGTVH
ncbi:MAG: Uma2 family endonuclease [Acidobacteriota bacterium]|nr:Uma2 family endonuclease [Acidobacteriota bacterium]